MESNWLEDFISLAETRSFSRSAEQRHVTQSAFSRRIKSLEAWLGSNLIDRTTFPTSLTPEGEIFYARATEMLAQITDVRSLLQGRQPSSHAAVDFAVHHTLSLTYLPALMPRLKSACGLVNAKITTYNAHDAMVMLAEGGCDLFLGFHHPLRPLQLDAGRYEMIAIDSEMLYPYVGCNRNGKPDVVLPGDSNAALPYLSYTGNAYLGRIADLILSHAGESIRFERHLEADTAESLKMLAIEGLGLAFLPESVARQEIEQKRLARADLGQPEWSARMDICLYRTRPSAQRLGKPIVARLWDYLSANRRTA